MGNHKRDVYSHCLCISMLPIQSGHKIQGNGKFRCSLLLCWTQCEGIFGPRPVPLCLLECRDRLRLDPACGAAPGSTQRTNLCIWSQVAVKLIGASREFLSAIIGLPG